MWKIINNLKEKGVTIILTTHYIEEAEQIADRIGIINKGKLLLVEDKKSLIKRMGQKTLYIKLRKIITKLPSSLKNYDLKLNNEKNVLIYEYDTKSERTGITKLLSDLSKENIVLQDMYSKNSSLEDIFIKLLKKNS